MTLAERQVCRTRTGMTFNEHDHSRNGDGRFTATARTEAASVTLAGNRPAPAHELFRMAAEEAAAGAPIQELEPASKEESRRLLDNRAGLPDGEVLHVELHHETTPRDQSGYAELTGPSDGRPLIVHTGSTNLPFRLASGKAVIWADSSAGNHLVVGRGTEAIIVSSPDAHVTVHVEDGAHAAFHCGAESDHLLAFTEGSGRVDVVYSTEDGPRPYARRTHP